MAKRNSVQTGNPYKPNIPVSVILWLLVLTIAPLQLFPNPIIICAIICERIFKETKCVD